MTNSTKTETATNRIFACTTRHSTSVVQGRSTSGGAPQGAGGGETHVIFACKASFFFSHYLQDLKDRDLLRPVIGEI